MIAKHAVASTQLASLVGCSPAIARIRDEIETLADSSASVLITGPSGSGKDVVAQLLHQRSRRAAQPFIALNCAAVAPELLESEMFGHEAGAFTGAIKARAGRFEAAHRGTLFLDEVGDMALPMQAKLLRALETRIVERVGSMLPIAVDVRLCAATSIDVFAAIDRGGFRSDLLYRIDVIRIVMPALAERPEDIPLLVAHFVASLPGPGIAFEDSALDLLMSQPWPGNVRELKNFVERANAHHCDSIIDADCAARLLRRDVAAASPPPRNPVPIKAVLPAGDVDLKTILSSMEQAYIVEALQASGGAIAASAKRLGLQRTTLIEKMRRLHISPPETA